MVIFKIHSQNYCFTCLTYTTCFMATWSFLEQGANRINKEWKTLFRCFKVFCTEDAHAPLCCSPSILVQQYQVQVQVQVLVDEYRKTNPAPLSVYISTYKKYTPGTIYIIDPGIVVLLLNRLTDVTTYYVFLCIRPPDLRMGPPLFKNTSSHQ